MPNDENLPELVLKPIPDSVDGELDPPLAKGESAWLPDGADGRTLFDTPNSADETVLVIFAQERFDAWRSQALAYINSTDGRTYVGQVAKGPYAAPNGLPSTSPMLLATQIEGTLFTPPYHGWVELSILGELKEGNLFPPLYRPRPNSPVTLLNAEQTKDTLKCDGNLRLGRALGYPELYVGLESGEKHHIPRHTLVVGTTGAGKSTCLARFIERLAEAGFCVLVIDVEGEYTTINEPASDSMHAALESHDLKPAGIDSSYLLVPTNAERANPHHRRIRRFSMDFANISPHVVTELLQGTEAQNDRFQQAYDAAAELVTHLGLTKNAVEHAERVRNWDDQESGYPDLKLAQVLDMAEAMSAVVANEDDIKVGYLHENGFRSNKDALMNKAREQKKRLSHRTSWYKTVGLISALHKSGLFDQHGTAAPDGRSIDSIKYKEMVAPGRVLIFDMQGVDSPQHRNLAISDLLRGVMAAQDELYAEAPSDNKPKTAIIIEEAHEFVSEERKRQMPTVFSQIQRIARRGRKRWLGLVFATQFPQHLPSELFTLCNNRILMRLGDQPTIDRLRKSVGGVPENLWHRLKNLPTGQGIVSAHGIDPAMIVALEPGRCKLRLVD